MKFFKYSLLLIGAIVFCSIQMNAQSSKYKLMLQMTNYQGEKAYLVVSLINAKGEYEKTLSVLGPNKKWYNSLEEWHKAQTKKAEQLSAITGASIAGGERSITSITLDDSKFDKGYKIRIESSVENQKYYKEDAVIPLTKDGFSEKVEGKGYVRYVKLNKVQ